MDEHDDAEGMHGTCALVRERLCACVDGEAAADATLDAHVRSCAGCGEFAAALVPLAGRFAAWREAPPPSGFESLAARFDARVARGPRLAVPGASGRTIALRLAASLLGAALVGLPAWVRSRGEHTHAPAHDGTETALLAPLRGSALLPQDARLTAWQPVVAAGLAAAPRPATQGDGR